MLHEFHAHVFALPDGVERDATREFCGGTIPVLRSAAGGPPTFDAFFPVAFEQALAALAQLPRLDAEPDGFFVIAGNRGDDRWQLDGQLFDFGDRLHRVELHGCCPGETLDAILGCVGWPATLLAFELVREGVALDEAAFRMFTACGGAS